MTKKKGSKKFEFDKRVLDTKNDIDYWNKLNSSESAFMKKFLREEYANDHSKKDSLYREAYGDLYNKKKIFKNSYGKPIGMRQVKFTEYNKMMFDLINVAKTFNDIDDGTKDEEKDIEKRVSLAGKGFEDYEDFVDFKNLKEDKSTINNLIKHYTYHEVLDLLRNDLRDKIIESYENSSIRLDLLIENYTWRVMLLAFRGKYENDKEKAQNRKKSKVKKKT